MIETRRLFFSGTSGLVLPVPNKSFYPEAFRDKSRLTYYSSLFNSIEINSSFYKPPGRSTVVKWAGEVYKDFRFTFKLWREITHRRSLMFDPGDITRFMDAISGAGDKKGCLLIQFPAGITIGNIEQINRLLELIHLSGNAMGWSLQAEFRHLSLYHPEVYGMLQKHDVGTVIHDMDRSATPLNVPEGKTIYLRFHGPEKGYRGNYADEVIGKYAKRIRSWIIEEKTVYVYFNNTLGSAIDNLITLNGLVGCEG